MASKALVATETSLARLAVEADEAITAAREAAALAIVAAGALAVDSDETSEVAAELAREIGRLVDDLEASRTSMTAPINAALKNINAVFKPITSELDAAKRRLKAGIGAWIETKRRAAEEMVHKVRALQEELGMEPSAEAAPVMLPDGAHVRREIDFEISDIKAIPDRYWSLDEQKVKADLRKGIEIPGIKVIVREQVIVR